MLAARATRALSVLVLDDNPATADSLAGYLRACGFDALAAHDVFSALELMIGWQPDAAVLDLHGPGGLKAARRLRERSGRPLALIALAARPALDHHQSQAVAFDHVLPKSADPSALVALLRR